MKKYLFLFSFCLILSFPLRAQTPEEDFLK